MTMYIFQVVKNAIATCDLCAIDFLLGLLGCNLYKNFVQIRGFLKLNLIFVSSYYSLFHIIKCINCYFSGHY